MSDHRKNITDRFAHFKPEVDDAAIEKSWEKIKYFLPQEKKRRAFLFFNRGYGNILPALLILGLLAGLFGLIVYKTKSEKEGGVVSTNNIKNNGRENGHQRERNEKTDGNKKQFLQPETAGLSNSKKIPDAEKALVAEKSTYLSYKSNDTEVKNSAQLNSKSGTGAVSVAGADSLPRQDLFSGRGVADSNKSIGQEHPELFFYQKLNPVFLDHFSEDILDSIVVSFIPTVRDDLPQPAKRARWNLELFGGPCLSATLIRYAGSNLAAGKEGVHFSLGLGATCLLKNRWNLYMNARLNGNNFSYSDELDGNKIVVRKQQLAGTSPFVVMDTTIRYIQVQSVNMVSSSRSYQLCLGMGYALLQKRKLSLEASLGLALKYTRYNFTLENSLGTDTLTFIRTLNSGPLDNEVQLPEEYHQKRLLMSCGLVPGLSMVYQFHSRIGFIFRPSCFIQLSRRKTTIGQESYYLKQNNTFLDIGLRIKL